jgi:hypothetical protein
MGSTFDMKTIVTRPRAANSRPGITVLVRAHGMCPPTISPDSTMHCLSMSCERSCALRRPRAIICLARNNCSSLERA